MGVAIDTIGSFVTAGATNPTSLKTVTVSPGDSLQIRSFPATNRAWLESMIAQTATKGKQRVLSPLLHDNVTGLTFATVDTDSYYLMNRHARQRLYPTDTLAVYSSAAAGASGILALLVYYENLPSSNARLANWGDISGQIKSIKGMEIDVTSSGTIGTWSDTAINATDKQLHANTDYAVLGMYSSVATGIIAIKGIDTGNLRMGMSGGINTYESSNYFVELSHRSGLPCIPVINAANAPSTYVSAISVASVSADNVTLVLAECGTNTGL